MSSAQLSTANQSTAYDELSKPFDLLVDLSLSLRYMIGVAGYEWVSWYMKPEYFPSTAAGLVSYEACYFLFGDKTLPTDARVAILEEDLDDPWSLAEIPHVLANARYFSQQTREHAVVGLGSVALINGVRFLAHSQIGSTKPVLRIEEETLPMMPNTLCLAVRNPRRL